MLQQKRVSMTEKLTRGFAYLSAVLLTFIIYFLLKDFFIFALENLTFEFLTDKPYSAGRKGGIYPIIISTLLILMTAIFFTIPIGTGTALFLTECQRDFPKLSKMISKTIYILSGVPSIVFGLFGNAFFSTYLGLGFSILSGGMTLALMSLPLYVTTLEQGILRVPKIYRLVPTSLGMTRRTELVSIILPYSFPAIILGIILSIGRSLAETAALIFTSGYVDRMPESLLDSGRSLSIHIYDLAMNVPGGNKNSYLSAFILLTLIIIINGLVNMILRWWFNKRISI